MDRRARLLGPVNQTHQIVELGAGYTPVAPKSEGWRSHTVDHATRDELRQKYSRGGAGVDLAEVDVNVIEDVDTVWSSGPLHEAVPAELLGQVDLVIASHTLEHLPDLIGFLASVSRLASSQGRISAAIPDRRYCFDCYKPWTTTGELLDVHRRGLTRHSLKTAFNHMAYSASTDRQLGWGPGPIERPVLMDPFKTAATVAASFQDASDGPYQDYHAWQFTPAGFRLVLLELTALGMSDWHVESLEAPGTFEFFVRLRRGGGLDIDPVELQRIRQGLLISQLVETREQVDFMLGPGGALKGMRGLADKSYQDFLLRVDEIDKANTGHAEPRNTPPANPIQTLWRRIRGARANG